MNDNDDHPPTIHENETISRRYINRAKSLWQRTIAPRIITVINRLDVHNGVITAFATIAIAALTWVLAGYANSQDQILARQIADSETAQRAFVYESAVLGPMTLKFGDGKTMSRFAFVWSNSGETPTRNLTIASACGHTKVEIKEGDNIEKHFPHLDKGTTTMFIAPKASDTVGSCAIRDDLMDDIANQRRFFYFWMRADYQDVFSAKWHKTKDCFGLVIQKDGTEDFPSCPDFSCVDDECKTQ